MKQPISFSRKSVFDTCKRAGYYKYVKYLVPRKKKATLTHGSLVHTGIENIYTTASIKEAIKSMNNKVKAMDKTFFDQNDYDKLNWSEVVAETQIKGYYHLFFLPELKKGVKIISTEKEYVCPIVNVHTNRPSKKFAFKFIPDLVILDENGELWVVEHKTTSQLGDTYFNRLAIDEQARGNLFYLEKIYKRKFAGIKYRIMKKPGITMSSNISVLDSSGNKIVLDSEGNRVMNSKTGDPIQTAVAAKGHVLQKRKETRAEFYERLATIINDNQEEYFQEKIFRVSDADRKEFQINIWNFAQDFEHMLKHKLFYKNTSICSIKNCEYMDLCSGHAKEEGEGSKYVTEEPKPNKEGGVENVAK